MALVLPHCLAQELRAQLGQLGLQDPLAQQDLLDLLARVEPAAAVDIAKRS